MSTAFRVVLEGEQEVPPRDTTASGLGTVIFDSTAVTASYSIPRPRSRLRARSGSSSTNTGDR